MAQNILWLFTLLTILFVGLLILKKEISLESVLLVGITIGLAVTFTVSYIKGKIQRRKDESLGTEENDGSS
ncbi:MAG: hypothetical protein N2317_07580 [Syntrophales bacterium]|nr:hypothetical protein [Syntrophales bacterium]